MGDIKKRIRQTQSATDSKDGSNNNSKNDTDDIKDSAKDSPKVTGVVGTSTVKKAARVSGKMRIG